MYYLILSTISEPQKHPQPSIKIFYKLQNIGKTKYTCQGFYKITLSAIKKLQWETKVLRHLEVKFDFLAS